MSRRPDFDPKNPESMFHNVGRKFTAELKLEFLAHLANYGRLGLAASYVGVTHGCVNEHRKTDPRFDELVLEAISHHREETVGIMVKQAVEGHPEYKFDKDGNLLSARRMFEPSLRLCVLKYYEPGFIETQKQEITVQGGAIMVPAPVADIGNWGAVVAASEAGGTPMVSSPSSAGGTSHESTRALPAGGTVHVSVDLPPKERPGRTVMTPRHEMPAAGPGFIGSAVFDSLTALAAEMERDAGAVVAPGDATADSEDRANASTVPTTDDPAV